MPDFLSFINEILWGSVMIYLLLGTGVWFTYRTRYIQFRYIRHSVNSLKNSLIPQAGGITSFQALCTSLAARVGSGNLAGIVLAVTAGGPGAVFWMWVSALLGMATSFAECSLAQLYKERDNHGQFRGGPAWYMARGLGMRWMGVLFSIFLLLAYGLVFNTVQANTLANAFHHAFELPKLATGLVLALLTLLVIIGGLKGVARLMQWLVPVMVLLWVGACMLICLWHIEVIPDVIALIFKSAFGWHEAAAGALGYTLSQALTSGFQRGMFSNEAGMGATPNIAAAAISWPPHPVAQGIVQMIGVFIDAFVICTASVVIILLVDPASLPESNRGIQLMQEAMVHLTGSWGAGFVALIAALFGFSSIVVNYIYAENNLVFLRIDSPRMLLLLRAASMLMLLLGTQLTFSFVWQLADIVMALMAITNLTALLLLSPVVTTLASDYLRQRKLGVKPVFDPSQYPDIQSQLSPDVWVQPPRK